DVRVGELEAGDDLGLTVTDDPARGDEFGIRDRAIPFGNAPAAGVAAARESGLYRLRRILAKRRVAAQPEIRPLRLRRLGSAHVHERLARHGRAHFHGARQPVDAGEVESVTARRARPSEIALNRGVV